MDPTGIVRSNSDSQSLVTATPKPRRVADSPFDLTAVADVILRSSDNVDFYVMKAFVAYSSRFFSRIFTLPQSNNPDEKETQDGIDIVQLDERSQPLRYTLLFCYPGPSPTIDDIYDLMAVAQIAEKYEMGVIEEQARHYKTISGHKGGSSSHLCVRVSVWLEGHRRDSCKKLSRRAFGTLPSFQRAQIHRSTRVPLPKRSSTKMFCCHKKKKGL